MRKLRLSMPRKNVLFSAMQKCPVWISSKFLFPGSSCGEEKAGVFSMDDREEACIFHANSI
jgi:hypothetical protein